MKSVSLKWCLKESVLRLFIFLGIYLCGDFLSKSEAGVLDCWQTLTELYELKALAKGFWFRSDEKMTSNAGHSVSPTFPYFEPQHHLSKTVYIVARDKRRHKSGLALLRYFVLAAHNAFGITALKFYDRLRHKILIKFIYFYNFN